MLYNPTISNAIDVEISCTGIKLNNA